MWRAALEALAARGLYAVAPDLAGFGDAEPDPPGTWERHVEALERDPGAGGARARRARRPRLGRADRAALGVRPPRRGVGGGRVATPASSPTASWHGLADALRTPGQGEELVDGMTRESFGQMLGAGQQRDRRRGARRVLQGVRRRAAPARAARALPQRRLLEAGALRRPARGARRPVPGAVGRGRPVRAGGRRSAASPTRSRAAELAGHPRHRALRVRGRAARRPRRRSPPSCTVAPRDARARPGRGPPVVLLHAGSGPRRLGVPARRGAARRDASRAARRPPRERALGGRRPQRWSLAGFARAVERLAAELDLRDWTLLGHSFGGFVAMQHLVDFPAGAVRRVASCTDASEDAAARRARGPARRSHAGGSVSAWRRARRASRSPRRRRSCATAWTGAARPRGWSPTRRRSRRCCATSSFRPAIWAAARLGRPRGAAGAGRLPGGPCWRSAARARPRSARRRPRGGSRPRRRTATC